MKKMACIIFACAVILFISACVYDNGNASMTSDRETSDITSCDGSTVNDISHYESFFDTSFDSAAYRDIKYLYDCFGALGEDDIFLLTMYDNPIDQYIKQRLSEAYTTNEIMRAVADKYTLWSREMDNAAELFAAVLDDKERSEFERIQNQWIENANSEYSLATELLLGTNDLVSSQLAYSITDAKAESCKLRTIRIKYLHYLLESVTDIQIEEYASLSFLKIDLN